MRKHYKEVFIGGPRHGQINHDAMPPGAPALQVMEMPDMRWLVSDPPDRIDKKIHTYNRRDIAFGRHGYDLTFWVHEDLVRDGRDDQAIVDFILFPFEI